MYIIGSTAGTTASSPATVCRQIEALSRRFAGEHIDAVYSSDLFRTMTTARAIYQPRGLELRTDPDLREIGGGVWEDRTWGQLHRDSAASLDAFNRADPAWHVQGSETYGAVQMRMTAALRRIAAAHEGQTAAVFSHGTAIRTALAKLYGYPLDQIDRVPHGDNTCVSKLLFDGDAVTVEYINDNSHLGELTTLGRQTWWKEDGVADYGRYNLWFRPLDFKTESRLYFEARQEAWKTIHHTMQGFNGYGFLRDAEDQSRYDGRSVMVAMREDTPAGVLQLDMRRDSGQGCGRYPVFLPDAGGPGPRAGYPAAGAGGGHLPAHGAGVSPPALCAGKRPRPAVLRKERLPEDRRGGRRPRLAGRAGEVFRL